MAMADYRQCDVCGCKAFYDANLNYEWPDKQGKGSWGQEITKDELVRDSGHKIDNLGDWAVICTDCAKTHRCVVLPLDNPETIPDWMVEAMAPALHASFLPSKSRHVEKSDSPRVGSR